MLLPPTAGLDELAEVGGADDELEEDDEQAAAIATQTSAAATWPTRAPMPSILSGRQRRRQGDGLRLA